MNITYTEGIVLNAMLRIGSTLPEYTSVRFVFTDGPDSTSRTWLLGLGKERTDVLTDDRCIADLTVTVSYEDMRALLKGELDSRMAYMQGKVLLDGDLDVAVELEKGLYLCIDSYAGKGKSACPMALTTI